MKLALIIAVFIVLLLYCARKAGGDADSRMNYH